ncbi:uncharacterized protein [Solanum lycopersicum]|uniref:uncharacterized protein n=1 Tax=Solanum lycopersicum TaxID=4081 RepID=UPI00374796D4
MEYHNNFPKISNNYSRYEPNSQPDRVNKQGVNVIQSTTRNPNSQQHGQNANNIAKNDKYYEPAPYTVVQSFAARLRYNQSKNEIPIVLNDPIHTTRQGFPTVLLEEDDYYVKLVAREYLEGKVQVDLTKTRPNYVWLGFKNSDPNKGRWLKVEYEGIPNYCFYCKHQGHMDEECTIKRKDDDFKKRKEMEAGKKGKEKAGNKNVQEQEKMTNETAGRTQNQQSREVNQNLPKKQLTNHQQENDTYSQFEPDQQVKLQEEQWQTQRKKQHKNQENNNSKSVWRPVSPQTQKSKNSRQQEQETAGMNTIPTQNFFSNLGVQEQQETGNKETEYNNGI